MYFTLPRQANEKLFGHTLFGDQFSLLIIILFYITFASKNSSVWGINIWFINSNNLIFNMRADKQLANSDNWTIDVKFNWFKNICFH